MKELNCCNCGTKFAMEDSIYADRLQDGDTFTCPNGHEQHFSESENKKLRDEVKRLKAMGESYIDSRTWWRNRYYTAKHSLSATKGVVTKLKMKLYPDRYED